MKEKNISNCFFKNNLKNFDDSDNFGYEKSYKMENKSIINRKSNKEQIEMTGNTSTKNNTSNESKNEDFCSPHKFGDSGNKNENYFLIKNRIENKLKIISILDEKNEKLNLRKNNFMRFSKINNERKNTNITINYDKLKISKLSDDLKIYNNSSNNLTDYNGILYHKNNNFEKINNKIRKITANLIKNKTIIENKVKNYNLCEEINLLLKEKEFLEIIKILSNFSIKKYLLERIKIPLVRNVEIITEYMDETFIRTIGKFQNFEVKSFMENRKIICVIFILWFILIIVILKFILK